MARFVNSCLSHEGVSGPLAKGQADSRRILVALTGGHRLQHARVVEEAARSSSPAPPAPPTPPASPASSSRGIAILRWVAFAACVGLFVHALAKSNLAAAWERIEAIGPIALLVVVPFPFALAMDAWAWKGLLAALGRKASWRTLFVIRIGTEAVTNSAPAGAMWADAISPLLVATRTGVPAVDVFAASTAKRWTVVRMHGGYVALCAAFGAGSILHASRVLMGSDVLLVSVFAASTGLVLLSIAIEALAARGKIAGRISGTLGSARFVRVEDVGRNATPPLRARRRAARAAVEGQARRRRRSLAHAGPVGVRGPRELRHLPAARRAARRDRGALVRRGALRGALERDVRSGVASACRTSAIWLFCRPTVCPMPHPSGRRSSCLKRLKEAFWIAIGFAILARSAPRAVILHPENADGPDFP